MNQFFKYPWLLLLEDGIQKKKSQDPDLDTFLPTEGFDSKPLNLDRIRKIMQVNLVFKSQTPYPLSTKKPAPPLTQGAPAPLQLGRV